MPDINELGQVLSGSGGPVHVDGRIIAQHGTVAQWLDRYHAIYQREVATNVWTIEIQDVRDGRCQQLSAYGCNELAARETWWAAWLAGLGLYGSVMPSAVAGLAPTDGDGRGAIARNGTIGLVPDRQAGAVVELVPPARS